MELRPGYKQTEVGVIPCDWKIKRIGELALVGSGGTPSRKNQAYWGGSIPWVTTSQIDFGSINSADQFITDLGLQNSAAKLLPKGTLLLALYGQGKTRGKVAILGFEAATNQACASIVLTCNAACEFVLHFLESRYAALRNASNTGSQENLNGQIVKDFPVVYPPLDEQRAIATALSDVDALLAKIDQLIAKKRDLKQAAMQQLLTGQTRLPGFSGEWEVKPMKSLGQTYGGLAGKTKEDFGHGSSKYIPFMNVMTDTVIDPTWLESVNIAQNEAQNLAKKGDLFFNGSSETPEEVGFCSVLLVDIPSLYLNSFCFGFRFNTDAKVCGLFFAYWFQGADGRAAMSVLAQGATRYNIAKSAFMRLSIPQPSQQEQTAIATVLSDMDAELTALEARRDKIRALKQGMMQALLTGRIRLIGSVD
jgi:type I restriction enzyme S subunit